MILSCHLNGQNNAKIQGDVYDFNKKPLARATISLVSKQDSLVLSYALTDRHGAFELVRVPTEQELVLFVSHVNSSLFEKEVLLKPGENIILDSIVMSGNQIEEIVVEGIAPIRLNGDTLEYKADYFKTRPNASVEELLQLLPGLQVNADGTIYYQGREVSGVRVNNKDFFAQDLTIATRNLDASLIDMVQVIKDKGESKRENIRRFGITHCAESENERRISQSGFWKILWWIGYPRPLRIRGLAQYLPRYATSEFYWFWQQHR